MSASGLDASDIEHVAPVDRRTIQRHIKRDTSPRNRSTVEAIAHALGVRPDWLEKGEGPMEPEPTPSLPGGGPARLGYLEEGAEAEVPSSVLIVLDFGGGTVVHVPVAVLGQGERSGPPIRATGRVVPAASPHTAGRAAPAGPRQTA